jgi:hypothetical protein
MLPYVSGDVSAPVVKIETHSHNKHWRAEREIIELQPRRPAVGALSALQPAADSIYARLLDGESAELVGASHDEAASP